MPSYTALADTAAPGYLPPPDILRGPGVAGRIDRWFFGLSAQDRARFLSHLDDVVAGLPGGMRLAFESALKAQGGTQSVLPMGTRSMQHLGTINWAAIGQVTGAIASIGAGLLISKDSQKSQESQVKAQTAHEAQMEQMRQEAALRSQQLALQAQVESAAIRSQTAAPAWQAAAKYGGLGLVAVAALGLFMLKGR